MKERELLRRSMEVEPAEWLDGLVTERVMALVESQPVSVPRAARAPAHVHPAEPAAARPRWRPGALGGRELWSWLLSACRRAIARAGAVGSDARVL